MRKLTEVKHIPKGICSQGQWWNQHCSLLKTSKHFSTKGIREGTLCYSSNSRLQEKGFWKIETSKPGLGSGPVTFGSNYCKVWKLFRKERKKKGQRHLSNRHSFLFPTLSPFSNLNIVVTGSDTVIISSQPFQMSSLSQQVTCHHNHGLGALGVFMPHSVLQGLDSFPSALPVLLSKCFIFFIIITGDPKAPTI